MSDAFNQMLAQGPTPIKFADPVNQMAQLMQLKNAQQKGVVNQMAIDSGQRQQADQAAYRNMLAQPGFNVNDPATQARMLGLGGGEDLTALGTLARNKIDTDTRRQALDDEVYKREVEGYSAAAPYNGTREQIAQHWYVGENNPILNTRGVFAQPGARENFMATLASEKGFAELQRMANAASSGVSQVDRAKIVRQEKLGAGQGGAGSTLESGGNVQQATTYPTGAYSVITRGGQQKVYAPNGKEVFGEEAARVIREGYAASAVDQGSRANWRRTGDDIGKEITASYAAVAKMRNSARIYDQALTALDQGAQSGAIANLFPSLFAPTINLEYAKNQLGLDVISGTTFGALSEGELRLAMSQGLPTGLEGEDLKKWIVSKKSANAKLSDYLERQADFLSNGGSRSAWLKNTGAETTDAAGVTPTAAGDIQEGEIYVHPDGRRIILKGGQWQSIP